LRIETNRNLEKSEKLRARDGERAVNQSAEIQTIPAVYQR
jgi:hypothetical protein